MEEITVIRTARKAHRCDTRSHNCVGTIQPGKRYAYSSLPPNSEIGNREWWHARTCAACAKTFSRAYDAELAEDDATPQPIRRPRVVTVEIPGVSR